VNAGIVGKFRVERSGHRSSLLNGDWIRAFSGKDFDAFADVRNLWGTDEDHFQRRFLLLVLETAEEFAVANRAVDLASVGVAADADVESPEAGLRGIFDLFGKEDGTGAGAERRLEANELFQLFKTGLAEKLEKGARFATRDDQAIDFVELLWLFDEHNLGAQLFEPAAVCVKIALQGQDSDDHLASKTFHHRGHRATQSYPRFDFNGWFSEIDEIARDLGTRYTLHAGFVQFCSLP